MTEVPKPKTIKIPGPDHPITIEPNPARVTVTLAGRVVADTTDALILREAAYPAVQYIPLKDVDRALIERTVAHFGRLDVAVNNAGTEGKPGAVTEQTPESYAATFDTRRSKA